jgi:hypothetical protein
MTETDDRVAALSDGQLADMSRRIDHLLDAGFLYPLERERFAAAQAAMAAEQAARDQCPEVNWTFERRCELPAGHDGWHAFHWADGSGVNRWPGGQS